MTIYLASESPRRSMLLQKIGIDFEHIKPNAEEITETQLSPEEYVKTNAIKKARSVLSQIDDGIIIAADTVVVKDDEILGKPLDENDAIRMLSKLSGAIHDVYTAIVVLEKGTDRMEIEVEQTRVEMREISTKEIQKYVESGEPLDAAGAYKIQERGAKFIRWIEGCYYNVVGLPISTLVEMLKKFNINV
ncbi:MAG: septum formation protein Maf [Candidatus Helarchaeota archaeon]|nr:septum formation protein Maf [Candidatus Helarchaeota archaeon]